MPQIAFHASIELSAEAAGELRALLDCDDDAQLSERLGGIALAATGEYIDMFLGVAPVAGMTETRERRLIRLVRDAFDGAMPPPSTIAAMFGMTSSAAGAFVRTASARHRGLLAEMMRAAMRKALENPGAEDGKRTVVIADPFIVTALNDLLRQSPAPKTSVRKGGDSMTKYVIDEGSYQYLLERLG